MLVKNLIVITLKIIPLLNLDFYTIFSVEHWFKLKELLSIDDTKYDDVMTQTHYVLQNVKNNPKAKNPGDLWTISTEKCKESLAKAGWEFLKKF